MNFTYLLIFAVFAIVIAIGLGIELGSEITTPIIYILFWLLYLITLATIVSVISAVWLYLSMRNKQGPQGIQGPQGDRGEVGPVGQCAPSCRDDICTNAILDTVAKQLHTLNNNQPVKLNNTYIRGKIKQMCASPEFKQLAPFNGPVNLINYLKNIWTDWITLIWRSGGAVSRTYFETIGAETEWDWTGNNPFDEIKKYDVYYWGMGPEYRPQIIDGCNLTDSNGNIFGGAVTMLKYATTDLYDPITDDTGINANDNATFWRPKQFTYNSITYYPLGDIVVGPKNIKPTYRKTRHVGNITIAEPAAGPNRETLLVGGDVLGPVDYSLLWTNKGYGGNEIWVWRPIGPTTPDKGDYIALGDVITTSAQPPPAGADAPIRCVPKSMTTRLPANGKVLWSSMGSKVPANLLMLGFKPNTDKDGEQYITAQHANAYNLFRGVNGMLADIPESDINGNFYSINVTLDAGTMLGGNDGSNTTTTPLKGKGYLKTPPTEVKYSVLAYLNMKNTATLQHEISKGEVQIDVAPNSSGVIYTVQTNGQCLKNAGSGKITLATCDNRIGAMLFNLEFTGNGAGQCRLSVGGSSDGASSKQFLIFDREMFSLVTVIPNKDTSKDPSLFQML